MTQPIIREAKQSDFPALLALDHECFPADIAYDVVDLAYYMNLEHSRTFVTEITHRIAGFLLVDIDPLRSPKPSATLVTLDVRDVMRRKGIGTALLDHMEARLTQQGVHRIRLQVEVTNTPAIKFYRRMGFVMLRTLKGYYGNGADAFLMERAI
jgi:ribosomal-protein-alanine N-acetyltransferase